jgi:hypothetical protein
MTGAWLCEPCAVSRGLMWGCHSAGRDDWHPHGRCEQAGLCGGCRAHRASPRQWHPDVGESPATAVALETRPPSATSGQFSLFD